MNPRSLISGLVIFLVSCATSVNALNQNDTTVNQISITNESSISHLDDRLTLLSEVLENKIQKAASILETLSVVPEDTDIAKRHIARNILSKFSDDLVSVLFLMPNGDVYLYEPYTRQKNLTKTNFSFRDYFNGALLTNDTFLGDVIVSHASGLKQAQLALPLFNLESKNKSISLDGILSAGLNFKTYDKILQTINLTNQERLVFLDNNGTRIADTDLIKRVNTRKNSIDESVFRNLQSFKNAIMSKSGVINETINGSKIQIQYVPVKAVQKNWALLLLNMPNNVKTTIH
jgi:hypothetical protein